MWEEVLNPFYRKLDGNLWENFSGQKIKDQPEKDSAFLCCTMCFLITETLENFVRDVSRHAHSHFVANDATTLFFSVLHMKKSIKMTIFILLYFRSPKG